MVRPLKIAVLLPSSNVHPLLGANLWEGLRLWLELHGGQMAGRKVELTREMATLDPRRNHAALSQLVGIERADIVVALMNPQQTEPVRAVFEQAGRLLFLPTVGANVALETGKSPNIFHNSLGYWQSNYAAGEWIGRHVARNVMTAPTMLDAGYHSHFAFHAGLQAAGGEVVRWRMADGRGFVLDMAPVLADAREFRPGAVFGMGCGEKAAQIARAYAQSGLAAEIPLWMTPFACEAPVLSMLGDEGVGLQSVFTWADGLKLPENERFCAQFADYAERPADPFAALAYETAQFLNLAVEATGGDMKQTGAWSAALQQAELDSPRGRVLMNPQVHSAVAPLYVRRVTGPGASARNEVVATLPAIPDGDPRFVNALAGGGVAGSWQNEYLVI